MSSMILLFGSCYNFFRKSRNLNKISIIFLLIFLFVQAGQAQISLALHSNNIKSFTINPAFAGMDDYIILNFSSQKSFLGINRAPLSFSTDISGRLGNFDFYRPNGLLNKTGIKIRDKIGFGAQIFMDQVGYLSNSGLNLTANYQMPILKGKLSMGLSLNAHQTAFRNTELNPNQPDDPLVPQTNETNYFSNFQAGLVYYRINNYFVGISTRNLHNHFFKRQESIVINEYETCHHNISAGKYFLLKNSKFMEIFMNTDISKKMQSIQCTSGFRYYYKKGSWISISENNNFKELQFSYSFLIRKISYQFHYTYYPGKVSGYQKGNIGIGIIARLGDLSKITIY